MSVGRFNLLWEPWIPYRSSAGRLGEGGLIEVLESAGEIRALEHPSPIVELVLYRLLLAFVYSAYRGPGTMREVERLLEAGQFDRDVFAEYARGVKDSFFLFDSERPFFQDPMLETDRDASTNIFVLARESASPGGYTVFDHTLNTEAATMPISEAARYLVADQMFGLMDGSGYRPSPLAFGVNVFAQGETLFQTICLNLLPYNSRQPIPSRLPEDGPSWEAVVPSRPDAIPKGWLSYMTRPYRRLLLAEPDDGHVRWVRRRSAAPLDKQWIESLNDPLLSYNVSEDAGYSAVRLRSERALWRDSHSLLSLIRKRDRVDPGYVRLVDRISARQPRLLLFGVEATNNAVSLWRRESLPLPTTLLENEDLLSLVRDALAGLEEVSRYLNDAVRELAKFELIPNWDVLSREEQSDQWRNLIRRPAPGKRSQSDNFAETTNVQRTFWLSAADPFGRYLTDLTGDPSGATVVFKNDVKTAARAALDTACRAMETNARGYRAATSARATLRRRLRSAFAELSSSGQHDEIRPKEVLT